MALSIENAQADRLARELAKATGESLTAAVTRALQERLERGRRHPKGRRRAQRASAAGSLVRFADQSRLAWGGWSKIDHFHFSRWARHEPRAS